MSAQATTTLATLEQAQELGLRPEEFDKINDLLDNNSWFGVMTTFLPKDDLFDNWYYRRDPTHVVFYKKETFQYIAFQRNWHVFFPSENVVLFYKK